MKHTINLTTTAIEIDEDTTLEEIQEACPVFFETAHGEDEVITEYRGSLIVQNTTRFSNNITRRMTTAYLFTPDLEGKPNTFCVGTGSDLRSVEEAEDLIDTIITTGRYTYGMQHTRETPTESSGSSVSVVW